jgi:hypothetical protein
MTENGTITTESRKERSSALPVVGVMAFLIGLFPTLVILVELALIYMLIVEPGIVLFVAVCLAPYILPLLTFRLLMLVRPIREGRQVLTPRTYSPWVTAYRMQHLFILLPFLESVLQAVPGLFSLWLRAWGSTIGRRVIWAGNVTVTDRSELVVGNDVFVGNLVYLSPHVVNPTGTHLLLYLKKIRIGSNVFISAGCRMGPGSTVHDNCFVPILTDLYVNQHYPPQQTEAKS